MPASAVHDRLPLEHHVDHRYRSTCSCGWRSTLYTAEAAADDAYRFHVEQCERAARDAADRDNR